MTLFRETYWWMEPAQRMPSPLMLSFMATYAHMEFMKHSSNFVSKSSHTTYFLSITFFFLNRGKGLIQFIALFLLILGLFPYLVLSELITHFSSFLIWENLALAHHLFHSEALGFSSPDGLNKRKRLSDLTWIHTVSHLPSAWAWQSRRLSRISPYTNLNHATLSRAFSKLDRVSTTLYVVRQ